MKRWAYKHWVCNMLASNFHTNIFLRKISWYSSFYWRCFFLYEICLNTERVPFGCYKSALPGTLLLTINTLEGVSTVSSNPVVLGPIGGESYKGLQNSGFIIYRLNQNPGAPRPLDSTDHRRRTEDRAKVVYVCWGMYLNAALTI